MSTATIVAISTAVVVVLVIIIAVMCMMYRRRAPVRHFAADRKTISSMEAWIISNQGQIEMQLTNRFRDVNVVPIDPAFEHSNPMPSDMRASLKLTQTQARSIVEDVEKSTEEGILSGSNPYIK